MSTSRSGSLKIIPLGGVGEIGKNLTVIEYGKDIVVIDCGVMFPDEDMLGIDLVIPDTTYLEDNKDRIRAILLTHGHEDHIGALPYVLKWLDDVPVYGTKLTLGLVELRLKEHGIKLGTRGNVISPGDKITAGCMSVEFIHVSHSIAGVVALAIRTPAGMIVHTADFKVDQTPIDGQVMDLRRFAELGEKGGLWVTLDDGAISVEFVPLARRRYRIVEADVSRAERPEDALLAALPEDAGADILRVLLTGEVSDELFGYKYTDFAPSPEAFQAESEKRVRELHMYDVLRADRCISVNSLEARVPFGDLDFVGYVMSVDPAKKMNVYGKGKYLLRKAFVGSYLPESILQREKAAFSDAVGHSLVDDLKAYAESRYGDDWQERAKRYSYHAQPFTKESLLYREIFEKYYPGQAEMVADFWMPNRSWEGCDVNDPSARVLSNYGASGQ